MTTFMDLARRIANVIAPGFLAPPPRLTRQERRAMERAARKRARRRGLR